MAFSEEQTRVKGEGFFHRDKEYIHHSGLNHHETAFERLTYRQGFLILLLVAIFIVGLTINWHATFTVIIATITLFYFTDILFNLFLIYRGFHGIPEIKITRKEIEAVKTKEWPTYTILCPLYKEKSILPQFIKGLNRLEYDKSKLQVLLLLEENDIETIEAAESLKRPKFIETIIVPGSLPQTKPKACNYGLKHATGQYIVIYDAEDIPEPTQLKKAYLAFKKSGNEIVCIQCKLDFYNHHQNVLTKTFTTEYALWFNLVLTGLQSLKAPIPLGGTSNHFRTKQLKEFGGWDSFNVTEDADLGMRIARKGYLTAMLDSTTMEEATSGIKNWFGQRRRWIKGYMQTYLVNTRSLKLYKLSFQSPKHALMFRFVIGGKVFSALISPIFWIITVSYFVLRPHIGRFIESFYPLPVLYIACLAVLFGNFLYMYYYMLGCARSNRYDLIKYVYLVPVYWLMMSAAAWSAFFELVTKPHYWSKTHHGIFLGKKSITREVEVLLSGRKKIDSATEASDE